jgi:hypothetical protein
MTETSRLIIGATGSGKSEGELVDLVRLADERRSAVVLLDGHGPLALAAAGHWEARGHETRMVYEPLRATDRVLTWAMLPRSDATDLTDRRLEEAEAREDLIQCLIVQRNLGSLNDRPWTKEWLEAAVRLIQAQPRSMPLTALLDAFRVGTAGYEQLLREAEVPEVVAKFRELEHLKRRNVVQYELQTGAGRRLLEAVCLSEPVRLRSRPGPFDWLDALREKRLIAFDGGGLRSKELKRTLFLLASMATIHAVRRHFALTRTPLPVVLVLEEAGALDLITPFVLNALQELRKAGLAAHVITQSTHDFGDAGVFEAVLANTPWQAWYLSLSPADQELGARALANATFDSLAVHFTRTRPVPDGSEEVATARGGTAFRTRYREVVEAHYKTPQLHEQEFRTKLATLKVGERLVRDLSGVRFERVIPLGPSRPLGLSEAYALAAIGRIRRQPIYLPVPPAAPSKSEPLPDAAALLRARQPARAPSDLSSPESPDTEPGQGSPEPEPR